MQRVVKQNEGSILFFFFWAAGILLCLEWDFYS
jgi:hypothetical protein